MMRLRWMGGVFSVVMLAASASRGTPKANPASCTGTAAAVATAFVAYSEAGGVRLYWMTLSEDKTAGFDLSRASSSGGPFVLVSGLIPAAGGPQSALYEYFDVSGSVGDYYLLAETETTGLRGQCAPITRVDEQPGATTPVNLQVQAGRNSNYLGTSSGGGPYDALIICPDAWAAALAPLRDHWNTFRHHTVLLMTLSQTGTTKEAIRSYIILLSALQRFDIVRL